MRELNTTELESKTHDYFLDVEYANPDDVKNKLTQLINFLCSQDISKNILDRITEDYLDLYQKLEPLNDQSPERTKKDIIESLLTPDLQGAFGYFLIDKKFKEPRKFSAHYIDLSWKWYSKGHNYSEQQDGFNSYFLKPFKELFDWYLSESQTEKEADYFSYKSQEKVFEKLEKLEELLTKQGFGQEIIFNEIEELKQLTKKLNKKNWGEVIKGKFVDLALGGVITKEAAIKAIEFITGTELNLLQ
ncbi:hypothetical protein MAR621_03664 [Maribacter dokdonensis]|uniref:hypothetical protein n=1 Tax=Maribacter dokdonensis TaxID=320912 RepID=UPI001B0D41B9|nr:hypothetical protein [Maribacter dokdonensis]CAG2533975.1 hypothetical protein MAR621_03664 [Maribacter dokdonensis]